MKHPLSVSQGLKIWMMGKSSLDSRLFNDGVAMCLVSSVPLGLRGQLGPASVSFSLSFLFSQCSVVS